MSVPPAAAQPAAVTPTAHFSRAAVQAAPAMAEVSASPQSTHNVATSVSNTVGAAPKEIDAAIVAAEKEALVAKRDLEKAGVRKDSFKLQSESLLSPYAQRSDDAASTAGTQGARSIGSRTARMRPLDLTLTLAGAMMLMVVVVALIGRGRPPVLSPPPPAPQPQFVSDSLSSQWVRPVGAADADSLAAPWAAPPPPGLDMLAG